MGRERRKNVRAYQRETNRLRVELEERFDSLLREQDDLADLADLVTARSAANEPFHRWMAYRQGFAPELVRRFLKNSKPESGPVLDPFAGSGTVAIECARAGRTACSIDAMPTLAHSLASRFLREVPAWPDMSMTADMGGLWAAAVHPAHQAAVLLAAARTVDGEGHRRAERLKPAAMVQQILEWMRVDCASPLPPVALVLCADARALPLKPASMGGVLTSPPYLSRYDYARVNEPMERLLGWRTKGALRRTQVRAARNLPTGNAKAPLPEVVAEIEREAATQGGPDRVRTVRGYFSDLARVIDGLADTLQDNAPCWINMAGTDHQRVYIPSDLIVAAIAAERGFRIEGIDIARELRPSGRHLGAMEHVAPRECVIRLRRKRR
ncbi:MAG: hypothetical protein EXS14_05120 [Planctomycetes bacterium]|nr:hypothetical protein [Planctomycetota bacterium]